MALASALAVARAIYKLPFPKRPTDRRRVTGGTGTGIREVSCHAVCLELLGGGDAQPIGTGHCTLSKMVLLACSPVLYFMHCW